MNDERRERVRVHAAELIRACASDIDATSSALKAMGIDNWPIDFLRTVEHQLRELAETIRTKYEFLGQLDSAVTDDQVSRTRLTLWLKSRASIMEVTAQALESLELPFSFRHLHEAMRELSGLAYGIGEGIISLPRLRAVPFATDERLQTARWLQQRAVRLKETVNERLVPLPIDAEEAAVLAWEREYPEMYRMLLVAQGFEQAAKDLLEGKDP